MLIHPVGEFSYSLDREAAQARVVSTLAKVGIATERHQSAPEIIAHCLSLCMNMGLWRCWSERLEITFQEIGPAETRVTINAVPALRRRARRGEHVTDLVALVSQLH